MSNNSGAIEMIAVDPNGYANKNHCREHVISTTIITYPTIYITIKEKDIPDIVYSI